MDSIASIPDILTHASEGLPIVHDHQQEPYFALCGLMQHKVQALEDMLIELACTAGHVVCGLQCSHLPLLYQHDAFRAKGRP